MTDTEKNLSNLFADFDFPFTEWETYRADFEKYSFEKSKADKAILSGEPYELNINDGAEIKSGCFYADIDTAHIEGFLNKGTEKEIIVMFDGSRTRNGGKDLAQLPTFLRWSWHGVTDATFISLEDPMYYLHDTLKLGWFYGTKAIDFRHSVARLIKKIASELGVSNENILLYGISGGGTAAIGTAKYLEGSTVVAINPQLTLSKYADAQHFQDVTGLDLSCNDEFGRNDIAAQASENKKSKFIILTNLASPHDYTVQLFEFCKALGITPQYGITQNENIYNWMFYAQGVPSPHSSFENPLIFRCILFVVQCIRSGAPLDEIAGFCKMINQIWREQYSAKKQVRDRDIKIKSLEDAVKEREEKIARVQAQLDRTLQGRIKKFLRRVKKAIKSKIKR